MQELFIDIQVCTLRVNCKYYRRNIYSTVATVFDSKIVMVVDISAQY